MEPYFDKRDYPCVYQHRLESKKRSEGVALIAFYAAFLIVILRKG